MSSADGSSRIRSSCSWSRPSSPVTFVPRRSFMPPSLLSRSRSRISASLATSGWPEEADQLRERRPELRAGDDRVEVTEPEVRLGQAEVVRELLPRRLGDDAWAGERHERTGLGEDDVTEAREARQD